MPWVHHMTLTSWFQLLQTKIYDNSYEKVATYKKSASVNVTHILCYITTGHLQARCIYQVHLPLHCWVCFKRVLLTVAPLLKGSCNIWDRALNKRAVSLDHQKTPVPLNTTTTDEKKTMEHRFNKHYFLVNDSLCIMNDTNVHCLYLTYACNSVVAIKLNTI